MREARGGHTAVTLNDGRILMIGGFGSGSVTASTEFFDPASGGFRAGPDMAGPRAGASAVLLADGTVLVAAGFDGRASLATAEIYDPATDQFRPTGSLAAARGGQAAVLLPDGRVLVTGGSTGGRDGAVPATTEIYSPVTGAWTDAADMTTRRHKHAAVGLDDGRALILGGSDERDGHGVYRSAEIYDPAAGAFTATADMTSPRYKFHDAVVRLGDGRVLIAGGAPRAELFDPATERFTHVGGDANAAFSFAAAVRVGDGSVVVTGGYDDTITLTDQILSYRP